MEEKNREMFDKMKKEYKEITIPESGVEQMKASIKKAKKDKKRRSAFRILAGTGGTVVAACAGLILLINVNPTVAYAMNEIPLLHNVIKVFTFRDFQYDSERYTADVSVPELHGKGDSLEVNKSTGEINDEIRTIANRVICEFKESVRPDGGYADLTVKYEIVNTTSQYFTLKLMVYQAAGSGSEQDYYYTIDLSSGERMNLADLFSDGADYITPISENIKKQMKEQMAEDENKSYWLDDEEVAEWNFDKIDKNQSFYVNSDGNVVITFNEGDVAPMYMGCVEFVIGEEVIADIRK